MLSSRISASRSHMPLCLLASDMNSTLNVNRHRGNRSPVKPIHYLHVRTFSLVETLKVPNLA